LLREMASALDAMPAKRLIADDLEHNGEVCALGCVGMARGLDMSKLDPENQEQVAKAFGIATALAMEIVYINDEWHHATPEARWLAVRKWVAKQIHSEALEKSGKEVK
jgi:hypothetical protein